MSEADGASNPGEYGGEQEGEVLHAKYLDYCSAQVADFLLLLSADQMYLLAEAAAEEAGISVDLTYEEIVRLATDRISRQLVLPPYEVWLEDYRKHPQYYDRYLMGLWEEERPELLEE